MDLLLAFLRLLFGLPAESSELEPVVVRPGGRTCGLRRRAVDDAGGKDAAGREEFAELFEFRARIALGNWQSLSRMRPGNVDRCFWDSLLRRSRD
jgi:hypothetical protein